MGERILFSQPAAEPGEPKLACVDFYADEIDVYGNVALQPDGTIATSFADYYPTVESAPEEGATVDDSLADMTDPEALKVITLNAIAEARQAFRQGKNETDTVIL